MFTGIVEETGEIASLSRGARAWRLQVAARKTAEGVATGDSMAVNGCCLTVVRAGAGRLAFDLLEETRRLTNLSDLRLGMAVNPSEAETFWSDFLRSLTRRGLRGVKLVISDAHEGLKAAAAKVLGATWQRCKVHYADDRIMPISNRWALSHRANELAMSA